MFFPSKKKRLWRARLKQSAATNTELHSPRQRHLLNNVYQQSYYPPLSSQISQNPFDYIQSCQNCLNLSFDDEKKPSNHLMEYYIRNFGESSLDFKEIQGRNQMIQQSTPQSVLAMKFVTAAKVFRNCCGAGDCSTNSSTLCQMSSPKMSHSSDSDSNQSNMATIDLSKKMFQGLYGMLKESQIATLLQAVVNRQSGVEVQSAQIHYMDQRNIKDCVLVPRELIMGQEPNVIACRLWVWSDLKCSSELKRVPLCPNEKDRVYVCCNPNHWSRLTLPGKCCIFNQKYEPWFSVDNIILYIFSNFHLKILIMAYKVV